MRNWINLAVFCLSLVYAAWLLWLVAAPANGMAIWDGESPEPAGIVYTQVPRAEGVAANFQHATDVGRINHTLAEADVVYENADGKVRVVHDCTTSPVICVAQEARVSPDGKKIAYSVGYGAELVEVVANGKRLGIKEIPGLTHAEIWIADLEKNVRFAVAGHDGKSIDRQPEWLDNETLVFASNRGGTYPYKNTFLGSEDQEWCRRNWPCVTDAAQEYGYGRAGMSMQIWQMGIDGKNAWNMTPHEQNALAPSVMTNGDILYSCWNGHENKNYDSNTASAPKTSKNQWWLCRMDGNGADSTVILGGHKPPTLKTKDYLAKDVTGGEGRSTLRAIRSVAEIRKAYLAVTNYYRANHVGSMGIIYGMSYSDPHVEGCSTEKCYQDSIGQSTRMGTGGYLPSDFKCKTCYGQDQDNAVRRDGKKRPMGKAGYPAPLPGTDHWLATQGWGTCFEAAQPIELDPNWLNGQPACHQVIVRMKRDLITDPFDPDQVEVVSGDPKFHRRDGRAVAPYIDLFGQEAPARPRKLTGEECYLAVVDARKAELHPKDPYDWARNFFAHSAHQGNAVSAENPAFHAQNMHALRVLLPEMWDITYAGTDKAEFKGVLNTWGHKSIRKYGDAPLLEDGSVKMQVPCETPLIMQGVDKQGLAIAHDSMLHSLRKGETRTCHGCHDGHSEERAQEIGKDRIERFAATLAAKTRPPLLKAENPVTFYNDVASLLKDRCLGCHTEWQGPYLYSKLAMDWKQVHVPERLRIDGQKGPGNHELARPYTSKYVSKFGRDSLLYWKCVGRRMDGRTDDQYRTDLDFGKNHNPSNVTDAECSVIGRWIDQGVQN